MKNAKLTARLLLLSTALLLAACSEAPQSATFASIDYSQGDPHYAVYVSGQGRSIISGLSF